MVDIVITPANVKSLSSISVQARAGVTVTAGQVVYKAADGRYNLADSNAGPPGNLPSGIALHAAAVDQPLVVHTAGLITIGGTLVAGSAYYLSETPGGMQPAADLSVTENVAQLGLATSTTVLDFRVTAPGVVL